MTGVTSQESAVSSQQSGDRSQESKLNVGILGCNSELLYKILAIQSFLKAIFIMSPSNSRYTVVIGEGN